MNMDKITQSIWTSKKICRMFICLAYIINTPLTDFNKKKEINKETNKQTTILY